ncbi:phage portal protein, lambda family [Gemmobacter megaterium]|uniref:Phage portal protein, lambda family n=1 Tax=Gemmobacter megaterium TaxID=1086013 RepID=A0A1N7KZT4_9RHOB|nr:phage portal protein [Gemmobacter megaterium]GGE04767.1 phage portal protein [Gemmobacter megaterium]SIS67093.1 phage portal protein, lambda family [Gemmobacter megaterium]
MSFPFGFGPLGRFFRPAQKRQIEAGGGGRRWEGAGMLHAPQTQTLAARGAAKARANAAYLNNPIANRAIEVWGSTLGKGWQVRSYDRAANDAFEDLIRPFMLPLARALVRDGEAFVQLVVTSAGQLRLKHLAADQIDPSLTRDLGGGARIMAGVEYDAEDQIVAYHVLREPPGSTFTLTNETVRVPAVDMLHIFDPLFPGQVRGITWLTPVLLKLRDRDEASDALLMQLKVAALMTGYISDPDGSVAELLGTTSEGALNLALEPAMMRILPPGASVTFSKPGDGLAQIDAFLKAIDREIAAGLSLTFAMLTGDLGEANYSSERVGLLEFRRRAEMLQRNLIEGQFLRPLWRRWIEVRTLAGELPAGPAAQAELRAVRFVPPGWAWVDPKNDVDADIAAINAGLKSREEVVAARGRDIDEVDEERARDRATMPNGGNQQ